MEYVVNAYEYVCDSVTKIRQQASQQSRQIAGDIKESFDFESYLNEIYYHLIYPAYETYANLHINLTKFKKEIIFDNFTETHRYCALSLCTIGVGLLTRKTFRGGIFTTSCATLGGYFGAGLIFYPEVYNSFFVIKKKKRATPLFDDDIQNEE